jgi:hypothetical protein
MPLELHSDQGSNVDGVLLNEICHLMGITKTHTAPYHPQGNAITERENKVIVDMLSHYCNERQTDWDMSLPVVMMAYRSSVHRILKQTPAIMMFGREIRLPLDTLYGPPPEEQHEFHTPSEYVAALVEAMKDVNTTVLENVEASYRYEKGRYDRYVQEQKLYEGQAVWLRMHPQTLTKSRKLMKPYLEPCIVVKRVSGAIYKIRLPRGMDKCVHGNRLKPYYGC